MDGQPQPPITPAQAPQPSDPLPSVPVPESAPLPPAASVQPVPTMSASPYPFAAPADPVGVPVAAPQKKSPKKLLIILASTIGGVFLLAIIALVIFFVFFYVSKKDYADAVSQFDTVATADASLSGDIASLTYDAGSATDTVFNNDIDSAKTSLQKVQTENAKLGSLRAVKIGAGQQAYASFNQKLTASLTFTDNFLTSIKAARPALKTCDAFYSASGASQDASTSAACATALGSVGTVPDPDMQQYVTTLLTNYKSLATITGQIATLSDPYGNDYNTYSSLRDQSYTIETTISNAASDFTSNLQKHQTAVDPSDAANTFSTFLTKQL